MTSDTGTATSTEEFVGRLFEDTLRAFEIFTVYMGDRLGLYKDLAESGPGTASEVARRTGLNERYVREWLEQQAVASILEVDDAGLPADRRRYTLPEAHAEALTKPDSPFSIAPAARFPASLGKVMPALLEAFRSGGGVAWEDFGPDATEAQGDFNRPWLRGQLASEYIPAIPELHARLQADPPARVLDMACGAGWCGISIAEAFPRVTVTGVDPDAGTLAQARRFAQERGVEGRVQFEAKDGAALAGSGPYDAAFIIEAVHDMSDPVAVLSAVRQALAPGANLIVVDEKVADGFTAPGDEIERFMYAASVLCCLPAGMTQQPSAATGTVMRRSTLERYAKEAGFGSVEVLDLEHPMLRFYQLR